VVKEVEGYSAKTAISPKIAKKLDKSQFLLKLITPTVRGGRRVPSKNCDFSKNCKIFELVMF